MLRRDAMSNPTCPRCRARLQFRDHFPVLSGECATDKESDCLDRLRYIAVWLYVAKGCDYCRKAKFSNANAEAAS
jgi:hypothetical protein